MKHAVILGHLDCRNKGNEAVLMGLVDGIRSVYPELPVYIPSFDPLYDRAYIGSPDSGIHITSYWRFLILEPFRVPESFSRSEYRFKRKFGFPRQNWYHKIFSMTYGPLVRKADFVLFSAKDLFSEDYGDNSLKRWMRDLAFATHLNENVYLWGASVGPFSDENERRFVQILQPIKKVILRESRSYEYMKTLIAPQRCRLIPDPAFALPTKEPDSYKFPEKEPGSYRIGFSISSGIISFRGLNENVYLHRFKKSILRVNRQHRTEVVFIPHVAVGRWNDDYAISRRLKKLLSGEEIKIILPPPDLPETAYKYMIESCDAFVGTRTHTIIAALAAGVPAISIAYSLKSYGILEDCYGDLNWLIDIKEMTEENLSQKIVDILNRRVELSKVISQKAVQAREKTVEGWNLLKSE